MSLWVDKHRPRELSKLDFHIDQADYLKNIAQQNDFPHLMFYGPSGEENINNLSNRKIDLQNKQQQFDNYFRRR